MMICTDCGVILTDEDAHYYERRCEACERAELDRHQMWRRGAVDPELDALYDVPQTVKH